MHFEERKDKIRWLIPSIRSGIERVIQQVLERAKVMPHEVYGVSARWAFNDGVDRYRPAHGTPEREFLENSLFYCAPAYQDSIGETLLNSIAVGAQRWEWYRPMPEDGLSIFERFANGQLQSALRAVSKVTTERLTSELITGLAADAGRHEIITAFETHFRMDRDEAIKAVNTGMLEDRDKRFAFKPDDPILNAFREIAKEADDTNQFWHSMHGILWRAGFEFETPRIKDFRNFVDEHVPPEMQKTMLARISKRGTAVRLTKTRGGRVVTQGPVVGSNLNTLTHQIHKLFEEETRHPERRRYEIAKPSAAVPLTKPNEPPVAEAPARPSYMTGIAIKKRTPKP